MTIDRTFILSCVSYDDRNGRLKIETHAMARSEVEQVLTQLETSGIASLVGLPINHAGLPASVEMATRDNGYSAKVSRVASGVSPISGTPVAFNGGAGIYMRGYGENEAWRDYIYPSADAKTIAPTYDGVRFAEDGLPESELSKKMSRLDLAADPAIRLPEKEIGVLFALIAKHGKRQPYEVFDEITPAADPDRFNDHGPAAQAIYRIGPDGLRVDETWQQLDPYTTARKYRFAGDNASVVTDRKIIPASAVSAHDRVISLILPTDMLLERVPSLAGLIDLVASQQNSQPSRRDRNLEGAAGAAGPGF